MLPGVLATQPSPFIHHHDHRIVSIQYRTAISTSLSHTHTHSLFNYLSIHAFPSHWSPGGGGVFPITAPKLTPQVSPPCLPCERTPNGCAHSSVSYSSPGNWDDPSL